MFTPFLIVSMRNTFKKEERLKSKKELEILFTKGESFSEFPVRTVYIRLDKESKYPAQVAFSVSKRKFKNAPDRNRIKRQLREAYRKNKHLLYGELEEQNIKVAILFIYLPRFKASSQQIEDKIIVSLQRLCQEVSSSK